MIGMTAGVRFARRACVLAAAVTLCRTACGGAIAQNSAPAAIVLAGGARPVVIPIVFDPLLNQRPIVYVSINDAKPRPFVVDTGTDFPLVIDQQAAKELKIELTTET